MSSIFFYGECIYQRSQACQVQNKLSLIPRLSHCPVLDGLQYAKILHAIKKLDGGTDWERG